MYRVSSFGDFKCAHCLAFVSSAHELSGVNNRNHCSYCLWSCHLDLYTAGDRLSACKAGMKPIGLTIKKSRNKYRLESRGELMLIHECTDCRSISINRIAADDDPSSLIMIFRESLACHHQIKLMCQQFGIMPLNADDMEMIELQLYGQRMEIPMY